MGCAPSHFVWFGVHVGSMHELVVPSARHSASLAQTAPTGSQALRMALQAWRCAPRQRVIPTVVHTGGLQRTLVVLSWTHSAALAQDAPAGSQPLRPALQI